MKIVVPLLPFLFLASTLQAGMPPNMILIVADGINRDVVGCYGANSKTPSIDRLAEHGIRYETAWSMPVRSISQVTLLTGQYPFRHATGIVPHLEGGSGSELKAGAVTIAKALQSHTVFPWKKREIKSGSN